MVSSHGNRYIFYRKADFIPKSKSQYNRSDGSLYHLVSKLIYGYFGERAVSIEINKISTFHYVYHVVLERKDFFVKISKYDEFKDTLYLENYIYNNVLKNLHIGLKIFAFDVSCNKYPFPFIILSRADGICLRDVNIDFDFFYKIIENLGRVVANYHFFLSTGFGFGLIDNETLIKTNEIKGCCKSWGEYIFLNFNKHLKFATDFKVIDTQEEDIIESFFERHKSLIFGNTKSCLLHSDLGSHNIFIDISTYNINTIIDWEDALLGDPIFDIAMFASFYRMHEFLNPFIEGYNSVKKIEEELFFLKFWIYYLRIVITKSVLRFRLGYDKIGKSLATPKIKMAIENLKKFS